jgi:hypothetical protein
MIEAVYSKLTNEFDSEPQKKQINVYLYIFFEPTKCEGLVVGTIIRSVLACLLAHLSVCLSVCLSGILPCPQILSYFDKTRHGRSEPQMQDRVRVARCFIGAMLKRCYSFIHAFIHTFLVSIIWPKVTVTQQFYSF